jgi:hypothetical protein
MSSTVRPSHYCTLVSVNDSSEDITSVLQGSRLMGLPSSNFTVQTLDTLAPSLIQ